MRFFTHGYRWVFLTFFVIAVIVACTTSPGKRSSQTTQEQPTQHNMIIFVADGLRPTWINATDTPSMNEIRERGVKFTNSHSLFPTFTTANASAIAQGADAKGVTPPVTI
jgi:predicted AlkP superfamily pyrophosphatase or phosphodiesterase